jgi:peroxiredoxin
MLDVGTTAPEIDVPDRDGARFRLSGALGRIATVVYFFPKAFTPGCTKETEHFKDSYNELRLVGANVVGISTDDADTQCRFAESLEAPFPMVGDPDGAIAELFDVRWPVVGVARRVTYVLDHERTIRGVFHHELDVAKHRDEVLRLVDEIYTSRRAPSSMRP